MSAHELDHLAIAVPSWAPAGAVLNRELGARWASGFHMEAFSPCQLAVAQDMRLELLEPGSGEHSFIQRFLSENDGHAAPHHITFKVHDIRAAIARAQEAGIEPILVNLEHPQWQEAFLHPRDTGLGFLAQMVQAPLSVEELTGTDDGGGLACPWEQNDTVPLQIPLIYGNVTHLSQAGAVLRDVLGAREYSTNMGAATAGFYWDEGADLLLSEIGDASGNGGIQGILALPADTDFSPRDFPEHLAAVLAAGVDHPEIGLKISVLANVPAGASP
ncbi:VOC family protein [Arthrobacter sp. LAPM80]|uniref:VOC family protein n=1 Tax=Arthrobacter sp. LAPM80 TaxID=3141788 RepID=UPI00398A84FC